MKNLRRTWLVILLLGLLIFLAFLFPSFVQDNLITPLAVVLWLLWRILQSVDQAFYWAGLVLVALGYFFGRLYLRLQESDILEPPSSFGSNAMLEKINYWRLSIQFASHKTRPNTLEHNLGMLLAALYASRQPETVQYKIYDDLKQRQIPLPEPVYALLFPPEPSGPRRSFKHILANLLDLRRRRLRRWTGREEADYCQALEPVLAFMESSLENRHDDGQFDPIQH